MQVSLISCLVIIAGVIALPAFEMDLDPQAEVEKNLEAW